MKVGDKVVCIAIKQHWLENRHVCPNIPELKQEYSVRSVVELHGYTGIRLEELVNPVSMFYEVGAAEVCFDAKCFRKIDDTPELSELTDEMILTAPTTKELQTA